MIKVLFICFVVFLVSPLSAQVDSGYIKCNLEFSQSVKQLYDSAMKPDEILKLYNQMFLKWNQCAQNFRSPNFTAKTLDNENLILDSILNQVIVINFWSVNCGPCIIENSILNGLADEFNNKNVAFISICLDNEYKMLKKISSRIRKIANGRSIFDLYGIEGYPQTLIVKKNHFIKQQFIGVNTKDIEGEVEKLRFVIEQALLE